MKAIHPKDRGVELLIGAHICIVCDGQIMHHCVKYIIFFVKDYYLKNSWEISWILGEAKDIMLN